MIEKHRPIDDDDPEAEPAVNLRFFVLKLCKKRKLRPLQSTPPSREFNLNSTKFFCRDGNTWNFRRRVGNEHAVWIPWDGIIVTPDMVDPCSSLNPFNYPFNYRREYDITSSASNVVYTVNGTEVDKLVEFV